MHPLPRLVATLTLIVGCDSGGSPRDTDAVRDADTAPAPGWEVSDRLPKGWDTDRLVRPALRDWEIEQDGRRVPATPDNTDARILLWRVVENPGSGAYEDRCVLWLRARVGAGGWALAHLYRDRRPWDKSIPGWLTRHPYSPQKAQLTFNCPPSNASVYQFLPDTEWEFDAPPGWRLVEGVLRAGAWRRATGQAPAVPVPRPPPSIERLRSRGPRQPNEDPTRTD
jgi:hypothetical protein